MWRISLTQLFLGLVFISFSQQILAAAGTTAGQFEVTPGGAASYSIPISVPPGTAGMLPQLALSYSSQGGNGEVGVGWTISGLSQITRCAANYEPDGFFDPVDFDANDRLCLNGARLVAVSGTYGQSGTEYRTEIESFSKIVQNGPLNGASTWFQVWSKDGLITEYGKDAAAFRVPGKNYSLMWAANRITDRSGNYIDFIYQQIPGDNLRLLTKIRYGGNTRSGQQPYSLIDFLYTTRPDQSESYITGGSQKVIGSRLLASIYTYSSGSATVKDYRLSYTLDPLRNQSVLKQVQECSGSGDCFPATVIKWQDSSPLAFSPTPGPSTSIGASATSANRDISRISYNDFNGDGRTDIYVIEGYGETKPSSIYLSLPSGGFSKINGPEHTIHGSSDGASLDISRVKFGDFNGDGLTDVYTVVGYGNTAADKIEINQGNGRFIARVGPETYVHNSGSGARRDVPRVRIADFNGDGLDDVYVVEGYGGATPDTIHLSNLNGTFSPITGPPTYVGASSDGGANDVSRVNFGDFNGDGLTDVYYIRGYGASTADAIFLNRGNGVFEDYPGPRTYVASSTSRGGLDIQRVQFGDFNGDGITDVFRLNGYVSSAPVSIYMMNSEAEFEELFGPSLYAYKHSSGLSRDVNRVKLIDMNSDGLTDIYYVDGYNSLTTDKIFLSKGDGGFLERSGIATRVSSNDDVAVSDVRRVSFGDFNGDGQLDVYLINGYGGSSADSVFNNTIQPLVVTKITNGLGNQIEIDYAPLTNSGVYTRTVSPYASYPYRYPISGSEVVSEHRTNDGQGRIRATRYAYKNLKVHMRGRGSLGFGAVTATDQTLGTSETTNYSQSFPHIGMPTSAWIKNANGQNIRNADYTHSAKYMGFGTARRVFPYVQKETTTDYEVTPYFHAVKTTVTTSNYDNNGNATMVDVAVHQGNQTHQPFHRTQSVNTYNDTLGYWMLGRLIRARVTKTDAAGNSQTRESTFTYDPFTGQLISEAIEPGTAKAITTTYTHDLYGNRIQASISGTGIQTRTSSTKYDARGQFPISITNALGHSETHTYDPGFGNRLTLTGPNGLTTRWEYDAFGRVIRESRADGTYTATSYAYCTTQCPTSNGKFVTRTIDSGGGQTLTVLDRSEQQVSQSSRGFDGSWIHRLIEYDNLGRVTRQSSPAYAGDSLHWTTFKYDVLNRILVEESPVDQHSYGGAFNTFRYNGLVVTQTDARNKDTVRTSNVIGQVVTVTDALGGIITNTYDPYGNLLTVTDPGGNTNSMQYDIRGNKIAMDDPDMGAWRYTYNALGELTQQTDAKGQKTTLQYDTLGRMVRRTEPEGVSTWTYDTRWQGALSETTGPNGFKQEAFYDDLGRGTTSTQHVDGKAYTTQQSYDSQSRVETITYPTGFAVKHQYNANGYLITVRDAATNKAYWQLENMDALGNVTIENMGNGISTVRSYDQVRGTVDTIFSGKGIGSEIQSLTYKWDVLNCLLERSDQNQGGLTERFEYDRLHRMTRAYLNGQQNLRIEYDALGNITHKEGVGDYSYGVKPHAVASIVGDRAAAYVYDANGNMLSGAGRTIEWTSFNKPRLIRRVTSEPTDLLGGLLGGGGSTNSAAQFSEFFYGTDRARYKQVIERSVNGTPENKTVIYVGGLYERHTKQNGIIEHQHFIQVGDRTIAIRTTRSNNANDTRYLHRDHLGSVDVITDESGNEVERFSYDAHGKRRGLAWTANDSDDLLTQAYTTNRGFTGHEHLDHLALIHMNGRVFDPIIGRFISADPHIQFADNSQSYNRYSYLMNNLLSATDPSGFFLKKLAGKVKKFFKNHGRQILAAALTIAGSTFGPIGAFLGGFVGGLIVGRGDLKAGLIGGVSALAAYGLAGGDFGVTGSLGGPGGFSNLNFDLGQIVNSGFNLTRMLDGNLDQFGGGSDGGGQGQSASVFIARSIQFKVQAGSRNAANGANSGAMANAVGGTPQAPFNRTDLQNIAAEAGRLRRLYSQDESGRNALVRENTQLALINNPLTLDLAVFAARSDVAYYEGLARMQLGLDLGRPGFPGVPMRGNTASTIDTIFSVLTTARSLLFPGQSTGRVAIPCGTDGCSVFVGEREVKFNGK